MAKIIGIDLGTTYSAVAYINDSGNPEVIRNKEGENIIPSCVKKGDSNSFDVGSEAKRDWGIDPSKNVALKFKRHMGTNKTQAVGNRELTPTELSAIVLKKMLSIAESQEGKVGEAVVTIPANFSNDAREATMAAAKQAGLNVKYIINEPTAAALYYAFKYNQEQNNDLNGTYAVYDLGGGTFDVSIIRVQGQDIEVLVSNGDGELGGDDFDQALQKLIADKYLKATGEQFCPEDFSLVDVENDAKKPLSKNTSTEIKIIRTKLEISREEFEASIKDLVVTAENLCESTLLEAGLTAQDIKSVFLAGGSTRIPCVRESIKRVFQQEPISSVNVDEVVALGAALYGAYKGDRSHLTAVQRSKIESVNISETSNMCFGTLTINSKTDEMQNSVIIEKGEKIPCTKKENFYTIGDNQTILACRLTESVNPETNPDYVKVIWEGELSLPSGRPAGQQIEITYSYDANQIMKCSYLDVASGRKKDVDIAMSKSNEILEEIKAFSVD